MPRNHPTRLGVFLRKHRFDIEEYPREMAVKLGITTAHLLLVELGKQRATDALLSKIADLYRLDLNKLQQLAKASNRTHKVELPMDSTPLARFTTATFLENVHSLNKDQLTAVLQIMNVKEPS